MGILWTGLFHTSDPPIISRVFAPRIVRHATRIVDAPRLLGVANAPSALALLHPQTRLCGNLSSDKHGIRQVNFFP
jgi:hypothetical protein